MDVTKVVPALFAAVAVAAFPATTSAQWASSPSVTIIVNPAPAYGYGAGYGYGADYGYGGPVYAPPAPVYPSPYAAAGYPYYGYGGPAYGGPGYGYARWRW
jgi:resuscitation-promoting factor RpfA